MSASSSLHLALGFLGPLVLGAMAPYWFISECPFASECSKPAWDRCKKCVSYESEDQCREFLHQHLCRSSLHFGQTAEAVAQAVEEATVHKDDDPTWDPEVVELQQQQQQLQQQQQHHHHKRGKTQDSRL